MLKPLKLHCPPDRLWLISDTHFGHAKPFILGPRGFTTVHEHDETLIARWAETVGPEDTVLHLGDFMVQSDCAGFWAMIRRLHFGRLCLLAGNHLSGVKQAYVEAVRHRFADLDDLQGGIAAEVYPLDVSVDGDPARTVTFLPEYAEFSVTKQHIVCSHYPLASWHGMGRGAIALHGHCHNSLKQVLPRRIDVGIEHFGRPVSLAHLLRLTAKQQPPVVDGHHCADPSP